MLTPNTSVSKSQPNETMKDAQRRQVWFQTYPTIGAEIIAVGTMFLRAKRSLHSSLLKNPPGEGTGPTSRTESGGFVVGRVPPRGGLSVFQQAVSGARAKSQSSMVPKTSPAT